MGAPSHASGEPGGTTGFGPRPLALVQPPESSAARLAAALIEKAVGPAERSPPGGRRRRPRARRAQALREQPRRRPRPPAQQIRKVTAGADQTSFEAPCIVYVRSSTRRDCASSRRIAGASNSSNLRRTARRKAAAEPEPSSRSLAQGRVARLQRFDDASTGSQCRRQLCLEVQFIKT